METATATLNEAENVTAETQSKSKTTKKTPKWKPVAKPKKKAPTLKNFEVSVVGSKVHPLVIENVVDESEAIRLFAIHKKLATPKYHFRAIEVVKAA